MTRKKVNVCGAKAFPYYLLSFWGGSRASIFYVSTSCMRFEYKTKKMKRENLFIMLSSSCWVFVLLSLAIITLNACPAFLLSLKDLNHLKVIVGIVFFSSKGFFNVSLINVNFLFLYCSLKLCQQNSFSRQFIVGVYSNCPFIINSLNS